MDFGCPKTDRVPPTANRCTGDDCHRNRDIYLVISYTNTRAFMHRWIFLQQRIDSFLKLMLTHLL